MCDLSERRISHAMFHLLLSKMLLGSQGCWCRRPQHLCSKLYSWACARTFVRAGSGCVYTNTAGQHSPMFGVMADGIPLVSESPSAGGIQNRSNAMCGWLVGSRTRVAPGSKLVRYQMLQSRKAPRPSGLNSANGCGGHSIYMALQGRSPLQLVIARTMVAPHDDACCSMRACLLKGSTPVYSICMCLRCDHDFLPPHDAVTIIACSTGSTVTAGWPPLTWTCVEATPTRPTSTVSGVLQGCTSEGGGGIVPALTCGNTIWHGS
jgi:hypothetical protein